MSGTLRVGVLGATGMVGQRFLALLENHPWFKVTTLAASANSAGKTYKDAVAGRWAMKTPIPAAVASMKVLNASAVDEVAGSVDFVFCAVDMPKDDTRKLEEDYAKREIPVVSNNSAHRGTADVPMMIPEINADHAAVIADQRKRLGTRRGFIAVKPNCSLQSYVPAIDPLMAFGPKDIFVCTYQAISGAGKTFETWPEMVDNVIPFIKGEEQKSEEEPMKILGQARGRQDCPRHLAAHLGPMHSRAGQRRSYGRGVRAFREEAHAGANPGVLEEGGRQTAAAQAAERSLAVSHLLQRGQSATDQARPRRRGRHGHHHRPPAP